jgi:hypothetical protein
MNGMFVSLALDDSTGYHRDFNNITSGKDVANISPNDHRSRDSVIQLEDTGARESQYYINPSVVSMMYLALSNLDTVSPIWIGDLYQMENKPSVDRFLLNHPQVREVLAEAQEHVRIHFGPEAKVRLKVVQEGIALKRTQLIACVVTDTPVKEALDNLRAFGRDWFTHEFMRVDGRINFDIACT